MLSGTGEENRERESSVEKWRGIGEMGRHICYTLYHLQYKSIHDFKQVFVKRERDREREREREREQNLKSIQKQCIFSTVVLICCEDRAWQLELK